MTGGSGDFTGAGTRGAIPGWTAGSGETLVVLEMNVFVQLETGFDFLDRFGGGFEGVVDVVAGGDVAGGVGEFLAAELVDFFDFGTFGLEVFGDGFDGVFDGAVDALRIEDDQALVFAAHWLDVVW